MFPFNITAKIPFKDLRRQGLQWDVPLPVTELERCDVWIRDLALVRTLLIRRRPRAYLFRDVVVRNCLS